MTKRSIRYWLLKSEPDEFGIDHLEAAANQTTSWSGVRNYQVRNLMRDVMRTGDQGFFYHSSCPEPGISGIVEVISDAYPDPTQFDRKSDYFDAKSASDTPRWLAMDVKLVCRLGRYVSLDELKANPGLEGLRALARGNRLSITEVSKPHWDLISGLGRI